MTGFACNDTDTPTTTAAVDPTSTIAGGPSTSSGSPPSGMAEPTTSSATEAIVAAYRSMWESMAMAAETSDHTAPSLSRYATGQALEALTHSLLTDRQRGLVTKGRPILAPRVIAVLPPAEPRKARVQDCRDSSTWRKYRTSGEPVPQPDHRRKIDAIVKIINGSWKVTDVTVLRAGSC